MFSPDQWHTEVPRDRLGNLSFRDRLLERCREDEEAQRAFLHACQHDIFFWINAFVWQFNPNAIGEGSEEIGPFLTWDFQEESVRTILDCLEHRHDLVIEKSREMGASWLCLLVMLWFVLFHPWKKFLCISRNVDAVDNSGDSDSLFWKLDFVVRHLPDWMTAGRYKHTKMLVANELLNSAITGQASTGKAGVGGRAFGMFIDEFSLIEEDYSVLHHTANTTGCRIFNGTQRGTETAFYELTQRVDYRKLRMHWSQHPDKRRGLYRYNMGSGKTDVLDASYPFAENFRFITDGLPTGGPYPGLRSPWYDDQCIRQGSPRAVAMNLDINPSGSVDQFFDPIIIAQLKSMYAVDPFWTGDLSVDAELGKPIEMVSSKGGSIKLWIHLDANGRPPPAPYGMGSDVSAGQGVTPSCLTITNGHTGEKVLEYSNSFVAPDKFAIVATALARLFKDASGEGAKMIWESNGPGGHFGKKVIELGYRNVYMRFSEDCLGWKATDRFGWNSNGEMKRILMEEYRSALQGHRFLNRSEPALNECLSFRYGGRGGVEHAEERSKDPLRGGSNHGDLVISDALAWKMAKAVYVGKKREEKLEIAPGTLAWRRQLAHNEHDEEKSWSR